MSQETVGVGLKHFNLHISSPAQLSSSRRSKTGEEMEKVEDEELPSVSIRNQKSTLSSSNVLTWFIDIMNMVHSAVCCDGDVIVRPVQSCRCEDVTQSAVKRLVWLVWLT